MIPTLEGTSWSLTAGKGFSIPLGARLTAAFASGRISGSSGCNRFTGAYQEFGQEIAVGPLASTRMACTEEVMAAERAFLAALDEISSWSATADEMTLSNRAGDDVLRFRRTEASPNSALR